ncbi:MAG: AMP-binding protein, partial [Rhodospirillales bacterium]|nr:AMP-binding protein [Rhodospirillales bacterium]
MVVGEAQPAAHDAGDGPGLSLFERFQAAARVAPERIALIDGPIRLTCAAVAARATALGAALQEAAPGAEPIGLLLAPSADFWIAILACLAVGRAYVALDLSHHPARNAGIIAESGLTTVLTATADAPEEPALPQTVRRLAIDALTREAGPAAILPVRRDPQAPACVLFTSGSTGQPKGIVNHEAALLARVEPYIAVAGLSRQDRFLTLSSPCTIAGTREGLSALLLGATLVVADLLQAGLSGVRQLIAEEGVTVLNAVPSVLRALMPRGSGADAQLAGLRVIRVGGETIFPSDIALYRAALGAACRIVVGYSSTEQVGMHWAVPPDAVPSGGLLPVGFPLPGGVVTLVDETGRTCPAGAVGELVMRGPHVALGYLRGGRLVAGTIEPDAETPGSRVFRTGDLMRLRPDGLYEFVARKDRQVKINGQRAEPGEVEAALWACPEVAEAAVISRRSGPSVWFEAFVVLSPGCRPSVLAEIGSRVASRVPAFMQPRRIHLLERMPRLPSQKTDVAALQEAAEGRTGAASDGPASSRSPSTLDTRPAAPMGETARSETPMGETVSAETLVEETWRTVLGRRAARDGTSFARSGGDSLKLLEFALLLERAIGRSLPLDRFHLGMSPADAVAALAPPAAGAPAPGPILADASEPHVVVLPGIYGDDLRLAAMRAALRERLHLVPIEYPDWPEMAAGDDPGEVLIAAALAQVARACPAGPLALLGYSYGGRVAFMLAQRLHAVGREVVLLGIIDTDFDPTPRGTLRRMTVALRNLREEVRSSFAFGGLSGVAGFVAARCLRDVVGLRRAQRSVLLWRPWLPARFRLVLDRWLQMVLRLAIAARWRARMSDPIRSAPVMLFRSDDHPPGAAEDLGWSALCPTLRLVRAPGDHETILDPEYRTAIVANLLLA